MKKPLVDDIDVQNIPENSAFRDSLHLLTLGRTHRLCENAQTMESFIDTTFLKLIIAIIYEVLNEIHTKGR